MYWSRLYISRGEPRFSLRALNPTIFPQASILLFEFSYHPRWFRPTSVRRLTHSFSTESYQDRPLARVRTSPEQSVLIPITERCERNRKQSKLERYRRIR